MGDDINAFIYCTALDFKYNTLLQNFMEKYDIKINLINNEFPLSYKYMLYSILIEMERRHIDGKLTLFQKSYLSLLLPQYICKDCANIIIEYIP